MPTYEIAAPDGRTLSIDGPTPPSEAELDQIFAAVQAPPTPSGAPPTEPPAAPMTMLGRPVHPNVAQQIRDMQARSQTGRDLVTGFAKGAAHTALDAGSLVHKIPGVTTAVNAALNLMPQTFGDQPTSADAAFTDARDRTAYSNGTQTAGGVAEGVAEAAIPITKGVQALPSTARAAATFQDVMGAAKNIPVNVNAPGNVALRIQQLAERGGSMPMAVRKFLNRVTDPKLGEMTYEEGRDFASNISRLSADEYGRLTPVIAREVAELRVTLNKAIGEAAGRAGKLKEYEAAMKEYAKAAKYKAALNSFLSGVKKAAVPATLAGLGYEAAHKMHDLLIGD